MPEVNIIVRAKDEATKTLQGIGGGLSNLGSGLFGIGVVGGVALAGLAVGVGKLATDAAKLEPTRITFKNLAEDIGSTSDALLKKLRPAVMGTMADADLMKAANKLMAMGLADTEDEAAKLAKMAVTLGTAMGTDATSSLENFTLMLANQSIPRLDTFGISSGQVRERIEELMEATEGLTREQAFMQAVMEIGEESMGKVGDVSGTMAVRMAAVQATMTNLKDELGIALMPLLEIFMDNVLSPLMGKISEWAPKITPVIEQFGYLAQAIMDPDQDWVSYLKNEVWEALDNAFGSDMADKIVEFVLNFAEEAGKFREYLETDLIPKLQEFWVEIQENVIPKVLDFAGALGDFATSDGVVLFFATLKFIADFISTLADAINALLEQIQRLNEWSAENLAAPELRGYLGRAQAGTYPAETYLAPSEGGRWEQRVNINVYGLPGLEDEVSSIIARHERRGH